jgi:hypothetical protein
MRPFLQLNTTLHHALSLQQQNHLQKVWDERLLDPMVMTPRELLESGINAMQCLTANNQFGSFASSYLKEVIAFSKSRLSRYPIFTKKILAIGYGRGYDSDWLKEALEAGLMPWWIDVSRVAIEFAQTDIRSQLQKARSTGVASQVRLKDIVHQGEIRTVLCTPEILDLDLESVQTWYLCRLISCLSRRSAKIVLQEIGKSLSEDWDIWKDNQIVIIAAYREDNPSIKSRSDDKKRTAELFTRRMVMSNIRRGAGRPTVALNEKKFAYFGVKICTALTIRAA